MQNQSTIVALDMNAELAKQALAFERGKPPEPQKNAPRYWVLYLGPGIERWEAIEPARGSVNGITRQEAYDRAAKGIDEYDADGFMLALKPDEATVFMTDSPPAQKGTIRRKALVLYANRSRPEEIEFRSVARTLWIAGRCGFAPGDIHEVAPNQGIGECIWRAPRDLVVPMPKELVGAAPDRVAHYESIVQRLAAAELETKLAEKVDTKKIANAALAEYRDTFSEASEPELVGRWSEESRRRYAELHEAFCGTGKDRFAEAPGLAIETVIKEAANAIRSGERLI